MLGFKQDHLFFSVDAGITASILGGQGGGASMRGTSHLRHATLAWD